MTKRSGKSNRDSETKVEEAIKRLREAHREGSHLLSELPIGRTYGQGMIDRRAAKEGTNPDRLRKLRAFAQAERGYTQQELQELCSLCRQHRRPIGFSFVTKFMTIPDKRQRTRFQQEAIHKRWSLAEVETELVKRFGRRRKGGRKPRIPDSLGGLLADLESRAIAWQRLLRELQKLPLTDQRRICWTDLPDGIQKVLKAVTEAMKCLEAHIDDHRKEAAKTSQRSPRA